MGLRFERTQAAALRQLGHNVESAGVGDTGLFFKAAESAEDNEPLVVYCSDAGQAQEMAALFATLGCKRPGVEDLNGNR